MREPVSDRGVRTKDSGIDSDVPVSDAAFGDEGVDNPPSPDGLEGNQPTRPVHGSSDQREERQREVKGNRGPDEIDGYGEGA